MAKEGVLWLVLVLLAKKIEFYQLMVIVFRALLVLMEIGLRLCQHAAQHGGLGFRLHICLFVLSVLLLMVSILKIARYS